MGKSGRGGYSAINSSDTDARAHEPDRVEREGDQGDVPTVDDEEDPLVSGSTQAGSAAASIYEENAAQPHNRCQRSEPAVLGYRGWSFSAAVAVCGIWVGMHMIAQSYPAPHFYRPDGFNALDVLDKPGLFLPPYGGWTSGIDVEGKSSFENTRHAESGLERPGGRGWVNDFAFYHSSALATAGCVVVVLSATVLTMASKRLTSLREQLISRPLQRLPTLRCLPAWLTKRFPTWTYGEWLCNFLLVSACVYWTVPNLRCRNRCERRPQNLTEAEAAAFEPVCTLTCTRWPWPLGDGNARHFATHLGTVSGYAMVLAMVPVPKNSPLLHIVGLTFERGVQIHRIMGRVAVITGVLHGLGYVVYWEQRGARSGDAFLSRTLSESSPFCLYEPILPWPWNTTTGEWLDSSADRPTGWGVPAGADAYTVDAARRCPWLYDASHMENSYACGDGTVCEGYYCCQEHGGRVLCAPSQPNMCNTNNSCADSFCCDSGACEREGGLRVCPPPADQPSGRALQGSVKRRMRRANGCVTRGYLYAMGFTGTRHGNLNFLGWIALLMFVLLALGGLERVRRNFFELFYKSHLICSLIGFVTLFGHYQYGKVDTCMPVLLVMAADYMLRWWLIARSGEARVEAIERIVMPSSAGDVIRLEISHPQIKVDEPGQYCFLRIGQLGHYQWHPFSVASTPKYANDTEEVSRRGGAAAAKGRHSFVVFIRDFGDWSGELVRSGPALLAPAEGGKLAPIGLDGMYGQIAVPFESYRGVVLVCGGIGCTPMFAVLMHLAETEVAKAIGRNVTLVWTFRELELVPAFARELQAALALGWDLRLHHTSAKAPSLASSSGGDDGAGDTDSLLSGGGGNAGDADPLAANLQMNEHGYCLQQLPDGFPADLAEHIRPARPKLPPIYKQVSSALVAHADDGAKHEAAGNGGGDGIDNQACAVLACGPMALVQSAKEACVAQHSGATHFEFHSEEFEW
jgi:NAD(P)H-flavin reductase